MDTSLFHTILPQGFLQVEPGQWIPFNRSGDCIGKQLFLINDPELYIDGLSEDLIERDQEGNITRFCFMIMLRIPY